MDDNELLLKEREEIKESIFQLKDMHRGNSSIVTVLDFLCDLIDNRSK